MIAVGVVYIPIRGSGSSDRVANPAILLRHILPNMLAPLLVQAMLGIATTELEAAGLSYLGLGAGPPAPE